MALFSKSTDNLAGYFDESMANEPLPMTCVAGYIFEPDPYIEFDNAMNEMLCDYGLEYFRASECFGSFGQFKKYGKRSPEPEIIERKVIALIRQYAILGVGAAASEAKFRLLLPLLHEEIMGGIYSMLCQWCLAEIIRWSKRNDFTGDMAYFFESGCASQSDANRDLQKIAAD